MAGDTDFLLAPLQLSLPNLLYPLTTSNTFNFTQTEPCVPLLGVMSAIDAGTDVLWAGLVGGAGTRMFYHSPAWTVVSASLDTTTLALDVARLPGTDWYLLRVPLLALMPVSQGPYALLLTLTSAMGSQCKRSEPFFTTVTPLSLDYGAPAVYASGNELMMTGNDLRCGGTVASLALQHTATRLAVDATLGATMVDDHELRFTIPNAVGDGTYRPHITTSNGCAYFGSEFQVQALTVELITYVGNSVHLRTGPWTDSNAAMTLVVQGTPLSMTSDFTRQTVTGQLGVANPCMHATHLIWTVGTRDLNVLLPCPDPFLFRYMYLLWTVAQPCRNNDGGCLSLYHPFLLAHCHDPFLLAWLQLSNTLACMQALCHPSNAWR